MAKTSEGRVVPPATQVAGQDAEPGANDAGGERADQGHHQRNAGAIHEPTEHIPAQVIRAQGEVQAAVLEPEGGEVIHVGTVSHIISRHTLLLRGFYWIQLAVRGEDWRKDGDEGQHGEHQQRDDGKFARQQEAAPGNARDQDCGLPGCHYCCHGFLLSR